MPSSPLVAAFLFALSPLLAQSTPPAIFTDPPPDKAHPAKMTVVHIPTHDLLINGVVYQASGAGVHPTIVICHGLPGNEKNLDLAQAARRAGWNAVTFNYRGSWGSPGSFRFAQTPEDAAAVLQKRALSSDHAGAVGLAKALGFLPLALSGNHINQITVDRDTSWPVTFTRN